MHCFYHSEKEAVGICKSCARGVCVECAVDLGHGVACRSRCEERGRLIVQLMDQSIERMKTSSAPGVRLILPATQESVRGVAGDLARYVDQTRDFQRTSGGFYMAMGVIALTIGILERMIFAGLLGVCFIAFGCWNWLRMRAPMRPKPPKTQTK